MNRLYSFLPSRSESRPTNEGKGEEPDATVEAEGIKVTSETKDKEELASRSSESEAVVSVTSGEEELVARPAGEENSKTQLNVLNEEELSRKRKGDILGWELYHDEHKRLKIIRQLTEDLKLAEVTVKTYVSYFKFSHRSLSKALRSLLKIVWPEDDLKIQHLLITHFTHHYLTFTDQSCIFQPALYNLSWAMIMLNDDLHSNHNGKKMTCEEFIANLNNASGDFEYPLKDMRKIYKSIKTKPLKAFRVKTRFPSVRKDSIASPEDPDGRTSFSSDYKQTTSTVHKIGNLLCKTVIDKHGKKTRKCQRSWKWVTAVLKGMALHLHNETSELCMAENKNAIRLNHAVAYLVEHQKRSHVLCLRTADSRIFYFQAESEEEQTSWVGIINFIAARYSAPPLNSVSHNNQAPRPHVLPSFPTSLSLQEQLEYHKDRLQRLSGHIDYYMTLPFWGGALVLEYTEQELKRYTTYVKALQEHVDDPGEGCSNSNVKKRRPHCAEIFNVLMHE